MFDQKDNKKLKETYEEIARTIPDFRELGHLVAFILRKAKSTA